MKIQCVAFFGFAGIVMAAASYLTAPQSKRPEFGVASIKPNAAGDHRMRMQLMRGGGLNVTGATLKDLVLTGYQLPAFQIVGGPSWMSSDRWDIQAKAEENTSQKQIYEMLQNLLTDRFQLKFHRETRTGPVYELVIARNGPKLSAAKSGSDDAAHDSQGSQARQSHGSGSHASSKSMTMAQLAQMLEEIVGRTVIDKTGLRGEYAIALSWTPDPGQRSAPADHRSPGQAGREEAPSNPNLPSIFTAIQEQLGLKMQSGRGPVEVLAIDSARKPVEQR